MGYHKPALLHESIEGLNIRPEGTYVDLTFGGGGHSLEVLKRLGKKGRLLAFDQDEDARANVPDDKRIIFIGANFRYLRNYLRYHQVDSVDGILADLGISSHQIDHPDRGFSFKADTELDMRMDVRTGLTAARVLKDYSLAELAHMFRSNGEIGNAMALARAIEKGRMEQEILTSGDLERSLHKFIPKSQPSKFLARVYQALRIEVNAETEALGEMLLQTTGCIRSGGRLAVISYHSIEDRMVKNFMRSGNLEGTISKDFFGNPETPWKLISRGVITPSPGELEANKRARSARLRIAEKRA
jgi:16S rRNA (cytosine1402-N4)-methyltransferase